MGLFVLLLTACASEPIHYYSLLPTSLPPAMTQPTHYAIELLPVNVPAESDRLEWVARQGDGSVKILTNVKWAAPLGEEVRDAIGALLAGEIGTSLANGMAIDSLSVLRLKLSLRRFDIAPGQPVLITTDWSLGAPGGLRLFCTNHFSAPSSHSTAEALATLRHWQLTLAQEIGRATQEWNIRTMPTCS
jgi:uncharacterized lipoprotein YmbA